MNKDLWYVSAPSSTTGTVKQLQEISAGNAGRYIPYLL